LLFVILAIKYREEDFVTFLIIAAIACAGIAGGAFNEAIKKAENEQRIPVDVRSEQR